jgi:hypothetical protein
MNAPQRHIVRTVQAVYVYCLYCTLSVRTLPVRTLPVRILSLCTLSVRTLPVSLLLKLFSYISTTILGNC